MNKQVNKGHRWQKGTSGNPLGRPLGARQKLSEKLLSDLTAEWERSGETVLTKLAATEPAKFAQIAYGLLPRDVFLSVQHDAPGNLDADDWVALRSVLAMIREANIVASPGEVATVIEDALRSSFAKLITDTSSAADENKSAS